MKPTVRKLTSDEMPASWRPTWVVCWVVELDGAIMGGPYASEAEAQAVASGEKAPDTDHTAP